MEPVAHEGSYVSSRGPRRSRRNFFPLAISPRALEQILADREARAAAAGPRAWPLCREFLLNKRDAPLVPVEEAAACPVPVLSQYTSPQYADLPVPPVADYRRCLSSLWIGREASPGPPRRRAPPWESRVSAAVFRGGATGRGVTAKENPRLRLCALSLAWHRERRHAPPILDARLTSWNPRHKWGANGELTIVDPARAAPPLSASSASGAHWLDVSAQALWKYYVFVDGNVGASRLGELAEQLFVVLWVRSELPQVSHAWKGLEPWTHFVPVRADLEDLEASLLWCRANDAEARRIAQALHDLLAPCLTQRGLEEELACELKRLPPPLSEERFGDSLRWIWRTRRSAVYVLLSPRGELLEFRPLANAAYENDWPREVIHEDKVALFLQRCRALWPEQPAVSLPPRNWWSNGALVCNVLPRGVWGESMLVEFHCMIIGSGALLAAPHHRVEPQARALS